MTLLVLLVIVGFALGIASDIHEERIDRHKERKKFDRKYKDW